MLSSARCLESRGKLADWTPETKASIFRRCQGLPRGSTRSSSGRIISCPGISKYESRTGARKAQVSRCRGKRKLELEPDTRCRLARWRWCETCCAERRLIRREGDGYYVKSMQAMRRKPITSFMRACELQIETYLMIYASPRAIS